MISAAATLATWPLVAAHFGQLPLLGVPVSLLAVPALAPAVISAAAAAVIGPDIATAGHTVRLDRGGAGRLAHRRSVHLSGVDAGNRLGRPPAAISMVQRPWRRRYWQRGRTASANGRGNGAKAGEV